MKYHFQDLMQFKPETFWLHQKYWNANWFLNYIQMSLSSSHLYWIGRLNMSKLRRLTVTQYPYSTSLHFIQETNIETEHLVLTLHSGNKQRLSIWSTLHSGNEQRLSIWSTLHSGNEQRLSIWSTLHSGN